MKIAIKIARTLQNMKQRDISHGHLIPSNIFIKDIAIISDIGFLALKKAVSVYQGYINKSAYSAPEVLMERGKIHNKK